LFFLTRDRVRDISLADVQRVATQVLVGSNRTLGQYVPTESPQRAPAPARVDVVQSLKDFKAHAAAAQTESFVASPANIDARTQRSLIEPGLQVALLPKPTRGQSVKATLSLRFGDEQSLKGWGEAPEALGALLDKGTASMSRQQIQDRLDALQSDVGISVSAGQLQVSIESRREHFAQVLKLVGEMLRQPTLPSDVLEEVRRQALAGLEEQRKEPGAVLANALARQDNPYARGDVRYARTFDEIEQDWRGVSLEKAVREALTTAFAQWRSPSAYQRVPDPWQNNHAARLVLQTPDKQNAAMTATMALAINDRDPDYAALMLANHLFGSGGDSRLWNRIREKEGLSYNVYSTVQWNPIEVNSQWSASAIFAPQNRDKVEKAFKEELQRSLSDGFTQTELDAGRKGLLNFRQLSRAQDERVAAGWVNNLYLKRTFADSARVDVALQALTLEQVNRAWRKFIKPEQLLLGLAGDFKGDKP
jgi:zinc protease